MGRHDLADGFPVRGERFGGAHGWQRNTPTKISVGNPAAECAHRLRARTPGGGAVGGRKVETQMHADRRGRAAGHRPDPIRVHLRASGFNLWTSTASRSLAGGRGEELRGGRFELPAGLEPMFLWLGKREIGQRAKAAMRIGVGQYFRVKH
jgi:hypothetical protein